MANVSDNAMHRHRHDGGAYRRIELITGISRRRRWTPAEKAALVAESMRPGVNVSDLAQRAEINQGLLQTWRRAALRKAAERGKVFVPLRLQELRTAVDDAPGDVAPTATGVIELESGRLRIRFSGLVDASALRLVLGYFGQSA